MSLIKKSDVKNHLSPRHRTKIHLCEPVDQVAAIDYAVAAPDATTAELSPFANDYSTEHTISGVASTPTANLTSPTLPRAPERSKSVQP